VPLLFQKGKNAHTIQECDYGVLGPCNFNWEKNTHAWTSLAQCHQTYGLEKMDYHHYKKKFKLCRAQCNCFFPS